MFHYQNLNACAPPSPRGPTPLLFSPAQAQLNFGSGPAHPADRTVAEPRPILLQIVNFNEGAPKQGPTAKTCAEPGVRNSSEVQILDLEGRVNRKESNLRAGRGARVKEER
jgi:hypothetical protein